MVCGSRALQSTPPRALGVPLAKANGPLRPAPAPRQVAVPESVLKKRKRQEKWAADKAAATSAAETKAAAKRKDIFKRAEAYVAEYRSAEQQLVTMKRAARKAGTFYVEPVRAASRAQQTARARDTVHCVHTAPLGVWPGDPTLRRRGCRC